MQKMNEKGAWAKSVIIFPNDDNDFKIFSAFFMELFMTDIGMDGDGETIT